MLLRHVLLFWAQDKLIEVSQSNGLTDVYYEGHCAFWEYWVSLFMEVLTIG